MSVLALKDTPLRQVKNVQQLLMNDQARGQLAAVAAKHMNAERMMRVVANAIRATPKLQECAPMSLLGALMHCAALGLEPNTPLGHVYLIPFENRRKGVVEVQVVIGYKGFIELSRRTGQLASIHSDVVYDDDELFSHEYGSNQHLRHRPGPRKGTRLGAYCHVKLDFGDGMTGEGHRFMTMDQIIEHRNRFSQGWKTAVKYGKTADSPWDEKGPNFEAMAMKTVVRALANRGELPMSIEFMEAMETDERHVDFGAFAMDPTAGLSVVPESDGEIIEGKPIAEQQKVAPEPKDSAAPRREPVAKTKPPVARRDDPPAEDHGVRRGDDRAAQQSPKAANQDAPNQGEPLGGDRSEEGPEPSSEHNTAETDLFAQDQGEPDQFDLVNDPLTKLIIADAMDLGADAARQVHAEWIETLRDNPKLFNALHAELERIGG